MKLIDTGDYPDWGFEKFPLVLSMRPKIRLHYAVPFPSPNEKGERFNVCTMALSPSPMEVRGFTHEFN